MAWMTDLGDNGIGGDYTPPIDAEVQGSSGILEVDIYRESPLLSLMTLTYILHFARFEKY